MCWCSKIFADVYGGGLNGEGMNKAKRKRARAASDPPVKTTEDLRARLRAFAELTREQAVRQVAASDPEDVTVLAAPLRRVRRRQ